MAFAMSTTSTASELGTRQQGPPDLSLDVSRKLWRVGSMYFFGGRKARARYLLFIVLILCIFSSALFVVMSYVQRDFSTALSSKDVAEFYRAIRRFVMIVIFAAPLDSFYQYMQVPSHTCRLCRSCLVSSGGHGCRSIFSPVISVLTPLIKPCNSLCSILQCYNDVL